MDSHTDDDSMRVGEVEPMPGYTGLVTRASTVMLSALRDCSACGLELSKRTLLDNAYITWTEIGLFFMCAVMWTQIRRGLTECLFKVDTPTILSFSLNFAYYTFTYTFLQEIHQFPLYFKNHSPYSRSLITGAFYQSSAFIGCL